MPTLVCTGCSSGLGLQALRHLFTHSAAPTPCATAWRVILGARDVAAAQMALTSFIPPTAPKAEVLKLDLESLDSVRSFAQEVKSLVGDESHAVAAEAAEKGIQCVLLNAGIYTANFTPLQSDGWCKEAIVNNYSQHLLLHLISPLLTPSSACSRPRVIITSSALHLRIPTVSVPSLPTTLKFPSTPSMERYRCSKFIQMANAHHWKSALREKGIDVIAISPGFVPASGLNRESPIWTRLFMNWVLGWFSFVSTLEQGGKAIASAIPSFSSDRVDDPPISQWLTEMRDKEGVLYVDVKAHRVDPHPAMLEQGKDLWDKWSPSFNEMQSW